MKQQLEIKKMNVSVNVLMLDNKRFTKSIYKQLPHYSLNDDNLSQYLYESEERKVLGFVKDDSVSGYSLLYIDNGVLERWEYPHWNIHDNQEFKGFISKLEQIFISC